MRLFRRQTTTPTIPASRAITKMLVRSENGDHYAVTDAGDASDFLIAKCPGGNDPAQAYSWGNGLGLTVILGVRLEYEPVSGEQLPVVTTKEGDWHYDTILREFVLQ